MSHALPPLPEWLSRKIDLQRRYNSTKSPALYAALAKCSAILDLETSTQSGGTWTSITDNLNSNPATFNAARRTNVASAGNGLPIQTFVPARPSCLVWPLIATNNQATNWGLGFWIKPATVSSGVNQTIYAAVSGITNGASASRVNIYQFNSTVNCIVYNGSGGRQLQVTVLSVSTWAWCRFSWDSARIDDDRLRTYINGANVSGVYAAIGGGTFPTNMVQPTGNALMGNFGDTTAGGAWSADVGSRIYAFSSDLTANEETALMNFKRPT